MTFYSESNEAINSFRILCTTSEIRHLFESLQWRRFIKRLSNIQLFLKICHLYGSVLANTKDLFVEPMFVIIGSNNNSK